MNADIDRRTFLGGVAAFTGALEAGLSPAQATAVAGEVSESQMGRGALEILQVCASVKPGEEVLILGDYETERIAQPIVSHATKLHGPWLRLTARGFHHPRWGH